MALAIGMLPAGCTGIGGPPDAGGDSADGPTAESRSPGIYDDVEGLCFVRDGSVWSIEDGAARRVVEASAPWSLRSSRSGEAITWMELRGTDAVMMAATRGDWRAEPVWTTSRGSLVVEAVHDDVTDTVWFSTSGEQTATIGVMERNVDGEERLLAHSVALGHSFAVDYQDGALVVPSATQDPATLYRIAEAARQLAHASAIFTPRLSPDGRRIAFTGQEDPGGDLRLWMVSVSDGTVVELESGVAAPSDPAWAPDGRSLAVRDTRTGTVWVVSADGRKKALDTGLHVDEGGLAW